MSLDLETFDTLTFDCYGTLIDWEAGILVALGRLLGTDLVESEADGLLEAFGRLESRIESGPYRRYRDVLIEVGRALCDEHGMETSEERLAAFGGSVVDWPPFADSPLALRRLAERYRLAVITNCDDDLFAASAARLGVTFEPVVTAQQVGSYKPSPRNFEAMLGRLATPRERVLHVAQSLYHDHVPARALGIRSVWVDRRRGRGGSGATPQADARPDLTVPDLASLADLADRAA